MYKLPIEKSEQSQHQRVSPTGKIFFAGSGMSQEVDIEQIKNDVNELSREIKGNFLAMPSDEIKIKSAKQIAKKYKINFRDILKLYSPSLSISGSKAWDKFGNIIKVK